METAQRRIAHWIVGVSMVLVVAACSSVPKYSGNTRVQHVLEVAHNMLGTSYCSKGSTPDCFDCSGFTSYCFGNVGISLPRTSGEQSSVGRIVTKGSLQAGDLVFFKTVASTVSHVGICLDSTSFIHASTSTGVMISKFSDTYWKPRYLGARRIM